MGESHEILQEFDGAELGDARRTKRLKKLATVLSNSPSQSLPSATGDDAGLEACYRWMNNDKVTPEAILAPHQRRTVERASQYPEVLVAHDTTSFRMSEGKTRTGLGPLLAKHGARGFFAHVALVMAPGEARDPLGVLAAHTFVRSDEPADRPSGRGRTKTLNRADNELHRWPKLVEAVEKQLSPHTTPIHVMDREASFYELLIRLRQANQRFVVRMALDRATPQPVEGTQRHVRVSEVLKSLSGIAERQVALSPRKKTRAPKSRERHPARPGRIARLSFRATSLELLRPSTLPKELPETLRVNLVHVVEVEPPDGHDPVEWKLLTSEPISNHDEVLRIVDIYRARWEIEELFKALKTGCAFEKRQFRSYQALRRTLAVLLPIAWRMLRMRALSRAAPERPATDVLSEPQLRILSAVSKRVPFSLTPMPTVVQALYAIAGLGGHLKRNGPPGWQTLGHGFDRLLEYEVGYALAQAEFEPTQM